MRIYLSGPMTGIENFNFDAFHEAAKNLRTLCNEVINPAEHFGGDTSRKRSEYMRKDIATLLDNIDAVAVLPGWERSKGARLEVAIARELDMKVLHADTLEPVDESGSIYSMLVKQVEELKSLVIEYRDRLIKADAELETVHLPKLQDTRPITVIANSLVNGDRGANYGHPFHDFSRTGKMWSAIMGCDVTPGQVALCMVQQNRWSRVSRMP
jgi:hypothetical protein